METKNIAAQMLKNKQKRDVSRDEKSLTIYSKLLEYYDLFKTRFGEANFTWLSVKTGLAKWKVKSYLRGTRKCLDIGEMGMIMFYLSNYDHNYKARTQVIKTKKSKNRTLFSDMKSNYCSDEKDCQCEECVKNDVKNYDRNGLKFFCIVIGSVLIFIIVLIVLFILRARYA